MANLLVSVPDDTFRLPPDVRGKMAEEFISTSAPVTVPDKAANQWAIDLIDTPSNAGGVLHIDHSGPSSYGLDVRNRQGASSAAVVHNYSTNAAVIIDGTQGGDLLRLRNAANAEYSPGTQGTGNFLSLYGYSGESPTTPVLLGAVNHLMGWISYRQSRPWSFTASGHTGPGLRATQSSGGTALEVLQSSTAAALALRVNTTSPQNAVSIEADNASVGSFFGLVVAGHRYGATVRTSQDGTSYYAFNVSKLGTGAGTALDIRNSGTGPSISFRNSGATEHARVNADGEFEHLANGKGLLLRSPDGTRYRVSVANGGTLQAVAA